MFCSVLESYVGLMANRVRISTTLSHTSDLDNCAMQVMVPLLVPEGTAAVAGRGPDISYY